MAAPLADKSNTFIQQLRAQRWTADDIKQQVTVKPTPSFHATENLTKFSQADQTGMSTGSESGMVMDPEDKARVVADLSAFKAEISRLKFAYLENHIKCNFVEHLLNASTVEVPSIEHSTAVEEERLASKQNLKALKERAQEIEGKLREQAVLFERAFEKANKDSKVVESLSKECEAMELEIGMLKRKRTFEERMTLDEANALCDEQIVEMQQLQDDVSTAKAAIHDTKSNIASTKRSLEKLTAKLAALTKEEEERRAKDTRDERVGTNCRWYTSATTLYKAMLGIKSASLSGDPPTELTLTYEIARSGPLGDELETQSLCIYFDRQGLIVGAELPGSSVSIQDIVDARLPAQDIRGIVQEVRNRLDYSK